MRYLVTGGLGVVGSLLSMHLVRQGHDVQIIDACESPRNHWIKRHMPLEQRGKIIEGRLEYLTPDFPLEEFDGIIHAAAHTGIPHSAIDPDDDWRSNVDATRALLEALRKSSDCPPTVIMSSVKPYRVHDMPICETHNRYTWSWKQTGIDESWPLEPDEPYAASKMAQSALALAYARSYDLPITCLRFSNLYGPAPCHGPRHGWLTWMCISAALGIPLQIQGSGFQVRDMLYTTDINAALLAALEHIEVTKGQVYNVGGGIGNTVSVREAVNRIGEHCEVDVCHAPGRKNEDPIFITDHSKFTKATDWGPLVGVQEGIQQIIDWARANRDDLSEIYRDVER